MLESSDYRQWLFQEFSERKHRSPAYSLRAFSAKIGVSPGSLSQILSGKRPLTKKSANKIADRLCLTPEERHDLLRSVVSEKARAMLDEEVPIEPDVELRSFPLDQFRLISDWYHYAILNLLEVRQAKRTAEWIAGRLDLTLARTEEALERMQRLGLVEEKLGKYRRIVEHLATPSDIPDVITRKYHYQNLKKAEESLDSDQVGQRDFSAITMAIDPDELPKAKSLIRRFRRNLFRQLSKGEKKRVYTLSVQLFPVDRA